MNKIKLGVIALSLGKSIGMSLSIVVMMVMTRVLEKDELAAYRQTLLTVSLVWPILELGLTHAVFYFIPVEKTRIRGRVMDAILILICSSSLFPLFVIAGGNDLLATTFDNPLLSPMLIWIVPYVMFTVPASIFEAVLITQGKAVISAVIGTVRQIIIGSAVILSLLLWGSPMLSIVTFSVIGTILSAFVMVVTILNTPKEPYTISTHSIKEMLSFSMPVALASFAGTYTIQTDKFLVSLISSPAEFAIYSVGALELPIVAVLSGSISALILVEMRKKIDANDPLGSLHLFKLSGEKSALVIFPIMTFFLVNGDVFIITLFTENYEPSTYPFLVYLLIIPLRATFFGSLFLAMGKKWFVVMREFFELALNVILSLILLYYLGSIGAAVATVVVAYFGTGFVSLIYLRKLLGVPIRELLPYRHYVTVFIHCIAAAIGFRLLSALSKTDMTPVYQLAIQSILYAVWVLYYLEGKVYSRDIFKKIYER